MLSGVGLFTLAGDDDRTFRDVQEALACLKRGHAVE
jgi:hypothetical protein